MNLQKKNSTFPHNDSGYYGVVSSIWELQCLENRRVSILMYDTGVDIELIACEKLWDLPYYASKMRVFSKFSDRSNFMLLQVKITDPTNLPYELKSDENIFIIYDECDFSRFANMRMATLKIESVFKTYIYTNIDEDFLVMIGRELPECVIGSMLNRIDHYIKEAGKQT